MSAIAAAIASMRAKGMSDTDILDIVAAMAAAETAPVRTARQERNARYYASQKRLKASESDVSDGIKTVSDATRAPLTRAEPEPNKTTYPTTSEANASSVEPQPADLPLTGELTLPIAKPKPPPNAARGCRLPPGFPGDDEREWTRINLRFTDDDFERCRDEFRDYWSGVPGQRGVKCDWPATFRNAARKYRPSGGSRQAYAAGNQRSDGSLLGAYQRAASRVRASNDVSRQRAGVFDHRDGELGIHYGIPAE